MSDETLSRVLSEMGWSVRVARVLSMMGLVTVGDLVKKEAADFAGLANFGPKSLREIKTTLEAMGVKWGEEAPSSKLQAPNNLQSPILNQPVDPTLPRSDASIPEMLLYRTRVGERWRCEKFALLAAEYFQAGESDYSGLMTFFHEVACRFPRSWFIARRLFGISPMVLPVEAMPDDYLPMSRPMLMESMGLTPEQLTAELDALRGVWINARQEAARQISDQRTENRGQRTEVSGQLSVVSGQQSEDSDEMAAAVLREFGFEESAFELPGRLPELNARERAWFVIRVEQMRKNLTEPMVADLARQILINELTLRRLEYELMGKMVGTVEWRRSADAKRELERLYLEQISNLDEICPWKSLVGGKISFRGVVSELIAGRQAYYANGDTRLVDKIRTAGEIEIDFRQSMQNPEPRYRYGQNLYLIESMDPRNLWDPKFESQFKHRTLKKVDHLARRLIDEARKIMGEELVDLMKDEYPDEEKAEGRMQNSE